MKRIISLLTVLGLSITWNNIANGAAGASATVTVTGGAITAISVSSGGSEYTTAPSVFILDTGGGSDASATATVSDGAVTGVTVTDGGSGYSSSSTVQVIFLPNIDDLGEPPEETPTDPPTDTPDTSSLPDEPEGSPEEGSTSRLINISTRGNVGTGDDVVIGGFVITGEEAKTVLVRAWGPSLGTLGVAGVLSDPFVYLVDQANPTVIVGSNDSWESAEGISQINETIFEPGDAKDAAMILTLQPGAYTAIVQGVGGATGVALIEVNEFE